MSEKSHEVRKAMDEQDPAFLARFKEFGITSFSIAHRTSAIMLLIIIGIMGVLSYRSIPKESAPEIQIPVVMISTLYPGVSPADIETLVTRPLEDELNTISDIEVLSSTSVEGYSSVSAEFATSVEIEEALQKVREKVDLARPNLPADAEEPIISEINFSEFPIMQVNLSGEYGLVRLKEIGEALQDRLEQNPRILRVDLRGGLEREVKVDIDLNRLQFYDIAIQDVVDAIRDENVNIPGGSIDVGALSYLVRVDGEFPDPSVIEELVITTFDGRPIYIRDVAGVDFGFAERTSYARLDGAPVVTLDIIKRSGENIISTAEEVKATIEEMRPIFPPSTVVKITSDASTDIEQMVSSLENNIISGLILIVAVLLFFLGVRTSVFVAISIPGSMLLSFIVLGFLGVTMNMVVLFSLILALGMLVDNAIVIVENIYRYMEEGWDSTMAARKATGEVALPVIAATATTLAAFAPLLFWPGIMGEFMKYLPLTLIVTLSSSLFMALVIIPTLCAMFMKLEGAPGKPQTRATRGTLLVVAGLAFVVAAVINPLTALLLAATVVLLYALHRFVLDRARHGFQQRVLPNLVGRYERRLRWALGHRALVLLGCAVVFVGTIGLFATFNHGVELFPESIPPAQISVSLESPVGTRAAISDSVALRLEEELRAMSGLEDVESLVTTVGGTGGGNPIMGGGSSSNTGTMTLSLVDFEERRHDSFETLAMLQNELGRMIAGADISVDKPQDGPPTGLPVNIEVVGSDPAVLKSLSDRILQVLRNAPVAEKLAGLESDMDEARAELSVNVDRERAALYNLSTQEVGSAIRGAVQGIEAAKYRTTNDEYDIIVRLAPQFREELSSLAELTVVADGGAQIPLLSVADWEVGEGYGSIRRKDMDRMVTISSDARSGYNSNAVLAEVQETLTGFVDSELPPGYALRYTGQSEEQDDAEGFLGGAFLMTLLLIGFILISQFNSVVKPLIILSSVIMSTVGVLLGLIVFNMPFVIIMTGVGIISLAGIVVNNAIVLIDYIDILRERDGMNRREALVQGGITRFRPVVLTAITTALGLVPLAIGLNFDFFGLYRDLSPELYWGGEQAAWWAPMAIAVIVGITFATVLTLVVVPVMYSLVDDFAAFFRRHYTTPAMEGGYGTGGERLSAGGGTTGQVAARASTSGGSGQADARFGHSGEPDRPVGATGRSRETAGSAGHGSARHGSGPGGEGAGEEEGKGSEERDVASARER